MTKINLEQRIGNWYMINPIKCDELIARGQTSTYIARQFGVSHVAVLKYINRTNQYQSWVKKRKKIIAKETKERTALQEELDQQKRLEKERLLVERKKEEEQLEPRVLEAVREYLTTSPEVLSEYTSIESKRIKKVLSRYGISRGKHYRHTIPIIVSGEVNLDQVIQDTDAQKQKYALLEAVQKERPVAIEQVRIKTGIEKETIEKVLREERLLLDLPSKDYRPEIDALIVKRLTFSEIGRELGFSKQMIRQYAGATGQSDFIKKYSGKEKRNKDTAPQKDLLQTFVRRQYQLAEQEYGRYSSRALDISSRGKGMTRRLSFLEKLLRLAKVYAEAEDRGERLSYQELGDRSGFGLPSEVCRILPKIGLKSMCWSVENRTEVTSSQKEAVKRSYFTDFRAPDIAYFIGLPINIIAQHFIALKKIRGRRERTKICLQTISNDGTGMQKGDILNYRRASQVFELDDLAQAEGISFTPKEVSGTVQLNPKLVEYARDNRLKIESEIKKLLTILYPGEEPNKPYRETKT